MENNCETIIIVDDDITNLTAARNTLAGKYSLATVPSGEKLFQMLERVSPSLILLDVEMPDMDGYSVMEGLQSKEKTAHIPVIFLTSRIDPESEIKGLSMGAVDYIFKPFSRELLVKRIDTHIAFEKQKKQLLKYNLALESEVNRKTRTVLELQSAILKAVAELVECRDVVTGGHIERTQSYLRMLIDFSSEHGIYTDEMKSWDVELLIMSSQLHDVGKISIKDELLMKPGKLTTEEFEEMKKHTTYGVDIIRRIERSATENEFLSFAEIMAGSHHEKWNGSGYPFGLKGEEIPLLGRLMALADVYDALRNERPYKEAYSHEMSVDIIAQEKGAHFDPLITDVFLAHEKEFNEISNKVIRAGETEVRRAEAGEGRRPSASNSRCKNCAIGGKMTGNARKMRRYHDIMIDALLKNKRYAEEMRSWEKSSLDLSACGTGDNQNKCSCPGFTNGLRGVDAPLQGGIMAIVDVYDSLTSDKPHRKRVTHREAVETIMNGSGSYFGPELVDVFLECEKEFEKAAEAA